MVFSKGRSSLFFFQVAAFRYINLIENKFTLKICPWPELNPGHLLLGRSSQSTVPQQQQALMRFWYQLLLLPCFVSFIGGNSNGSSSSTLRHVIVVVVAINLICSRLLLLLACFLAWLLCCCCSCSNLVQHDLFTLLLTISAFQSKSQASVSTS